MYSLGGEREVGGFLGRITLLEGERSGEGGGHSSQNRV